MAYKFIVTYTFHRDDTRDAFKTLLEEMRFVHIDQSTFALRTITPKNLSRLKSQIEGFHYNNTMHVDDVINIFYPAEMDGLPCMKRIKYRYNPASRQFEFRPVI